MYSMPVNMYSMPGKKHDNNKPSIGLIDPDFLTGLAKVLDFGKEKYGLDNWRNGIHVSRLISACYRYLGEINKRNDVDSESNLPAVYHLASEVMFLAWMLENKKEYDDRYDPEKGRLSSVAKLPSLGGIAYCNKLDEHPCVVASQGWNLGEHPA